MKKYTPYIIIAILLIWAIHNCERKNYYKDTGSANATALTDSVKYFKNRLGTQTASIKTMLLDKKGMQDLLLSKDKELAALSKEFAKIKYVTKSKSTAKFDSISVKFDTPIVLHPNDTINRFERSGAVFTEWYSLGYKVNNDSLVIDPFETWTQTTVITGIKRKWFLGKETLTTDITNTNPHITVTGITSAELTVSTSFWKKWYVWLAAGVVGGLLIK